MKDSPAPEKNVADRVPGFGRLPSTPDYGNLAMTVCTMCGDDFIPDAGLCEACGGGGNLIDTLVDNLSTAMRHGLLSTEDDIREVLVVSLTDVSE